MRRTTKGVSPNVRAVHRLGEIYAREAAQRARSQAEGWLRVVENRKQWRRMLLALSSCGASLTSELVAQTNEIVPPTSASGSRLTASGPRMSASGLRMSASGGSTTRGLRGQATSCGKVIRPSSEHTKRSSGRGKESTASRPDSCAKKLSRSERMPTSSARYLEANARAATRSKPNPDADPKLCGVLPACARECRFHREGAANPPLPLVRRTGSLE